MSVNFTGGCKCGALRYELSAEPKAHVICQCKDCQKFSGAGQNAVIMVSADNFALTGEATIFEYGGGSGNAVRNAFCPNCGSPIFGGPVGAKVVMVRAGSLDDPAVFKPGMVVYSESAAPWDHLDPAIPHNPPKL